MSFPFRPTSTMTAFLVALAASWRGESGIASLTREEALIGLAGMVLYAAGFVALLADWQHAV